MSNGAEGIESQEDQANRLFDEIITLRQEEVMLNGFNDAQRQVQPNEVIQNAYNELKEIDAERAEQALYGRLPETSAEKPKVPEASPIRSRHPDERNLSDMMRAKKAHAELKELLGDFK